MQAKYGNMLKDKNIRRWHDNVARGSPITADVYLRRLGGFCDMNKITPQELVKMKERKLHDLMLDSVTELEKKKHAGSYITHIIKSVKNWLEFNGKPVKFKIKIRGAGDTPTLREERTPTQEELKRIFLSADGKSRIACVLIAHSGLRPEVLGDYKGTDGLRIRNFPELAINAGGTAEFKKIPTMIKVTTDLSKNKRDYITFLSAEGCEYLKSYLEMRIRSGEKITKESSIIKPKKADKEFITSINIGDAIRNAIRKAGFGWRPYVLRRYFATQLMLAESRGLVIRDYRQFWMGHEGDIEAVYTLNKSLTQETMEDMREAYKKAQKYLQTIEMEKDEDDIKKMFKRQLLLVAGFKADDINEEYYELDDEEFQKIVREKLVRGIENNGNRQKVVEINDVENYLSSGWEFVGALPNNKAILKLPELS